MSIASELNALNDHILGAYDAIDTKGGTIPQNKNMANLPDAIDSIPSGGVDNNWAAVMQGDTNALYDNDATSIREYMFGQGNANNSIYLTSVSVPNAAIVGGRAFYYQGKIVSINLPKVATLKGEQNFNHCSSLSEIKLPALNYIDNTSQRANETFYYCLAIQKIDLGNNTTSLNGNFYSETFRYCTNLKALILRWNSVALVRQSNALNNSGISSGTGYIYVPKSLVSNYKSSSNWSTYANQIRAIEDYSDDGTVNGNITV